MPTILTHAAVPLALAAGLGRRAVPVPLLCAGVVASALPDIDVLAFRFGIAYGHEWGHRGASHSFMFALLLAAFAAWAAPLLRCGRRRAAWFVGACAASHGLLDMLTNGGRGVALWWPFSDARLFWPWRPIEASPLSLHRLLSGRGVEVIATELLWVWLAAGIVALGLRSLRTAWPHEGAEGRTR